MAKKLKMIPSSQLDPLIEERSRLMSRTLALAYVIKSIRYQLKWANILENNAKSEAHKNIAIHLKDRLRAELAAKEMEMARMDAALGKLTKDVKVHVEEIFRFE